MPELGVAALSYAQQGLSVHPLWSQTKRPRWSGWPQRATNDVGPLTEHWHANPEDNVGLVTGQRSRLLVVDLDRKNGKDGVNEWRGTLRTYGDIGSTWTARTPSGGVHVYLEAPSGVVVRTTYGALAPGIDTPAQVAAPPSVTPAGAYEWTDRPPSIALAPDWLIDLIGKGQTVPSETKGRSVFSVPRSGGVNWKSLYFPVGTRNVQMFRHASNLRRYGAGDEALMSFMLWLNEEACELPLGWDELDAIHRSVCRFPIEQDFSTVTEQVRADFLRALLREGSVTTGEMVDLGHHERMVRRAREYFGSLVDQHRISESGGDRGSGYWQSSLTSPLLSLLSGLWSI